MFLNSFYKRGCFSESLQWLPIYQKPKYLRLCVFLDYFPNCSPFLLYAQKGLTDS